MTDIDDQGLTSGPMTPNELDDTVTHDFVEVTRDDVQPEDTPAEELIGGKFKTNEDLLAAYEELQKKLGAPAEEDPVDDPAPDDKTIKKMGEEEDTDQPNGDDTPSSEESTDTESIDVVKYANEFFEKGELTEDSYKELAEKHNLPKDIVDTFMDGIQAKQQLRMVEIHKAAGGEEGYNDMLDWGTKNLSSDDIDAFNDALDKAVLSGEYRDLNVIVKGIKAQMGGTEPRYLKAKNTNTPSSGVTPFANRTEMTKAMADPRYQSDPKYVESVVARVAVSDF